MESTNKKNKGNKELSIVDLLCSAGYLPPRNERDLDRFERIYSEKQFEIEAHFVNADAIFDKVMDESKVKTKKIRPKTDQSFLRAASSIKFDSERSMTDVLYQDLDKNK